MTREEVLKFVTYCDEVMDFNVPGLGNHYNSLPLCIMDDVYSLRANYNTVIKLIGNYSEAFLNGDRYVAGHTLKEFVNNIDKVGDFYEFTRKYIGFFNKSCGRLKIELCYELAKKLIDIGVNTLEDFQNYKNKFVLECTIRSVKGLADAAVQYLFMLIGDTSQVKVDTHVMKSVRDSLGRVLSISETQTLYALAVEMMQDKHPGLTVSRLDNIVWTYYHKR